ncbi:MAG: carboxypeptidase-like regulatory domain-containing protein, partial [Methanobacterium sp.]|nr:carboxypeptidase-like regulatory domain-containing protein [Methanobacterium sp.]
MKNQCYLIFALTFFILIFVSSAYAEDNQTASLEQDSMNNTGTLPQIVSSLESPGNSVISGKVHDCITNDPFPGVNLTVSYNGSIIASNITDDDGSYQINFLSNYNAFNVTASHIGHNSVTKEIILSPLSTSEQFGVADFRLGTTTLYSLTYVNILTGNDSWTGNSSTYQGDNIGPKQTIQAGINVTEFGGTLNIASGLYNLAPPGYLGIAYELEVNRDLTIYGEDRDSTIISGCLLNRVFMINSGNVVIVNLTIANGQVPVGSSSSNGGSGGGIFNQGNLTLQNCILCNNTAGAGGDGTSSHSAGNGGNGGAIYNTNTLTLIDCDLYNNQAGNGGNAYINLFPTHDGGNGGSGGAIYNCNSLNIDNCNIYDNSAGKGGYSQGGDTAKSGGDGGAIYNNATSLAIITNSFIYNN